MLNGAKPAGIVGSEKLPMGAPGAVNSSMVPLRKLAAKMASLAVVIASPLYTALDTLESCSALVPPLHPSMLPSSDAKRNTSPLNELVPLNTCPVIGSAPGIETTSACFTPAPLYSVASPVPLSDTQNGLPPLSEIPQGLIRSASVTLVTRFVWTRSEERRVGKE